MADNDGVRNFRILLFIWGGIGNMVMALPMISAIRRQRPDAKVAIVVEKSDMAGLMAAGSSAAVIALDDPAFRGLPGKMLLVRRLRLLRPDVALSSVPWPFLRYEILAGCSGAKKKLVLPGGKRALRSNYCSGHRSNIENNLSVLRQLGIDDGLSIPELPANLPDQAFARSFLRDFSLPRSEGVAGMHPGAGDPGRRFSEDIFIELGKRLSARGCGVVIVGGSEEQALKQRIARQIGAGAVCTPPGLQLGQTLGLVQACRLFISNDSGLAHCSAALGVPTIVLFGPADQRISGPVGRQVCIVTSRTGCRPCYYPGKRLRCPAKDRPCLRITFAGLLQQLSGELKESFA